MLLNFNFLEIKINNCLMLIGLKLGCLGYQGFRDYRGFDQQRYMSDLNFKFSVGELVWLNNNVIEIEIGFLGGFDHQL